LEARPDGRGRVVTNANFATRRGFDLRFGDTGSASTMRVWWRDQFAV
jgi:hypothetical protein